MHVIKYTNVMAVAAVASVWIGASAPAFADTVSLQCDLIPPVTGNFSGESVYVLLDLGAHVAVSGYGDSASPNSRENSSPLTEDSDRFTWTYKDIRGNNSWIVD